MLSHVLQIARSIYSMPPDHGAAIAAHIFADPELKGEWLEELAAMRTRIDDMRGRLAQELRKATGGGTFDFIRTQRGMFSLLGVSPQAVERLRERHHIYMLSDSRMNLAGLMPHNISYVAECIAASLRAPDSMR
jgi:aspartate aminotransferase